MERGDEMVGPSGVVDHGGGASDNFLETLTLDQLDARLRQLPANCNLVQEYLPLLTAKSNVVESGSDAGRSILDDFKALMRRIKLAQVKSSKRKFAKLTRNVVCIAHNRGEALEMIPSVEKARVLLTTAQARSRTVKIEDQLSPIHVDFLAVCISAQMYHIASEMTIPKQIPSDRVLEATDVQLFYYYWSLVCTARQKYNEALQNLQLVFAVPATVPTDVVVDAWKKYILIFLISNVQQLQLSNFSDQNTTPYTMIVKAAAKFFAQGSFYAMLTHSPAIRHYNLLAQAFVDQPKKDVSEILERYKEAFRKDDNLGLVKKVVSALHRRKILRLTKTFLTLTLADIAEKVKLSSPHEAESILLEMINENEISASIDERTGMVTFQELNDVPCMYKRNGVVGNLDEQTERCLESMSRILALQEAMDERQRIVSRSSKKV